MKAIYWPLSAVLLTGAAQAQDLDAGSLDLRNAKLQALVAARESLDAHGEARRALAAVSKTIGAAKDAKTAEARTLALVEAERALVEAVALAAASEAKAAAALGATTNMREAAAVEVRATAVLSVARLRALVGAYEAWAASRKARRALATATDTHEGAAVLAAMLAGMRRIRGQPEWNALKRDSPLLRTDRGADTEPPP